MQREYNALTSFSDGISYSLAQTVEEVIDVGTLQQCEFLLAARISRAFNKLRSMYIWTRPVFFLLLIICVVTGKKRDTAKKKNSDEIFVEWDEDAFLSQISFYLSFI